MKLITVYDMHDRSYWTPILAPSSLSAELFAQQTFKNNKRVMIRTDTMDNEDVIENLRQQGVKSLQYDQLESGQWAWVAK